MNNKQMLSNDDDDDCSIKKILQMLEITWYESFFVERGIVNSKDLRTTTVDEVAEICFGERKHAELILLTIEDLMEKRARAASNRATGEKDEFDRRAMTAGAMYSETFLGRAEKVYDMHMGCENMGPMLYALLRFVKPTNVLEIGAGYTTTFLLQALKDNEHELKRYERMREENSCAVMNSANGTRVPWSNDEYFVDRAKKRYRPSLHVVDNMAHEYTTAHLVTGDDEDGILVFHDCDAFDEDLASTLASAIKFFDFMWIDLGAANRIDSFLKRFWFRVRPGGYVAVHSTLTNSLSRAWLEKMRTLAKNGGRNEDNLMSEYGLFSEMSFLEPHKLFQNSFTLFQRRDEHPIDSTKYAEPILTKFP